MKRMPTKGYVLGIIILIISGPIISATSILTYQEDQTPKGYLNRISNLGTNQKIIEAIEMVSESLLREYLWELTVNIGPRRTSTYGCEKAAKYLYQQFENMGLDTRYQEWSSWNTNLPYRLFRSENIEATLLGNGDLSDEVLIFNAHYDTVKDAPGAIDDGSGVAAVLMAAYVLRQFDFNRTIKFVTFSGEENGLLGSRAYVNEIYDDDTDVLVEFNADMIGYAVTADEGKNLSVSATEDARWIVDEIKHVSNNYEINLNVQGPWIIQPGGNRRGSDYHDFALHGYEAVAFWESGHYEYGHSPEDTIDKVNFSYLVNMTKLIVASLAHDIDVYYPQIRIGAPRRGRLYYDDRTIKNLKYEKTWVIDNFLICTEVKPGDAPIDRVEFFYDGKLLYNDTEMPYQFRLNERSIKKHTIEVILHDEIGRTARDQITFRFTNLYKKN